MMWNTGITINNNYYITKIDRIFIILIDIITIFVFIFGRKYMESEEFKNKLFLQIIIFTYLMKSLIILNNWLYIYFIWEGLGIISYTLINYWNNNINNKKAALKTIIYNRIGDIGLLYNIIIIGDTEIYNILGNNNNNIYLYLFLYIKSVQFIGIPWLLNAMVTPTPVSSLLHSGTMVCSGIYLAIKYNIEIKYIEIWIIIVVVLFFMLKDIKQIIALSTSYNISLMFNNIGKLGYIHLINHGLYKSILFMLSSSVIHSFSLQDIRKLQGITYILPMYNIIFIYIFNILPEIMINISKEFFYQSSSFFNYILLMIIGLIYILFSKFLFKLFLSKPNFNYYRNNTTIGKEIIIFLILSIFLSFNILEYVSVNHTLFDYIIIISYIIPGYYMNIDLTKHLENIMNGITYKIIRMGYKIYKEIIIINWWWKG